MKQSRFKVHARATPFEHELTRTPGSSISGELFVEVDDDTFFPAEHWGDYVVPVLGWWIERAMSLNLADYEAFFMVMDGPYQMRMRRHPGSDDVDLTLWREGRRIDAKDYVISYSRCLATLRGAAKSVINDLKRLGYACEGETATLQSRLEHLIRLEADIKARGMT